jgi:hypothetical protein
MGDIVFSWLVCTLRSVLSEEPSGRLSSHLLSSQLGLLTEAGLDHQNTERGTTQQAMASVSLKLALKASLLFLLVGPQVLRPVAGQSASPAPTPCKGAVSTAKKIKDGFIFREGLSPPLDPGLDRTLPYEGKKSNTWPDSSQYPFAS